MFGLVQALEALRAATAMPWETWARRLLPAGAEPALPLAHSPAPADEPALPPPAGSSLMPLLGEQDWDLPENWNEDPGSGFDFGAGRSAAVRALPDQEGADLLRCWVRGRGIELLHAARCGAAGDEAAAVFAELWVESFGEACPPGQGAQWSSAMEVALRAVRLLHAAELIATERASSRRCGLFERALLVHEAWLRRHSDWRAWRTGNHYLVATAGRFLLAACLKETPRRRRDARRAWTLFWREWRRQVGFDGLHFESSTHYHLLAAETALQVFEVGARLDMTVSPKSLEKLELALSAVASLARPDGSIAAIGDSDDGCFCEAGNGRAPGALEDAWPLLRRAARLFDRPFGPLLRPACFAAGGIAVLAVDGEVPVHVTVSFTNRGRSGTGGHGHDDCGSYDYWAGAPIITDRGTGSYTGDPRQRETFRSSRSHSVIEVDARTQNPPVESRPFRRDDRARPFLSGWEPSGGGAVEIGHHAWCGPPGAVAVLRRLSLGETGVLQVRDELTGSGDHRLSLRVQWAPGLEPAGSSVTARGVSVPVWKGWRELATLRVVADGFQELELACEEGEHSPRQGLTLPAKTTVLGGETTLPTVLEHSVAPADDAGAASHDFRRGRCPLMTCSRFNPCFGALVAVLATVLALPAAASLGTPAEPEVRRWEYIVLLRASQQIADPIGRAETAALKAGGAVLETSRSEVGPAHADYRMLVRTRDPEMIHEILREMRRVPGVLGASTVQLPETPTYAGGPEFISSYTGDLDPNPSDPRVIVRHDVPPFLDKKDLLENAPLPAGPSTGYASTGGFTLNVSELFNRMKEGNWRKREDRMKRGYLPILPPESDAGSSERR